MTLPEQIDFFFAPPLPLQAGAVRSPLYLVRQEMQDCLIGTLVAEDAIITHPGERHRLFATVMVIMSGIDLLAKFHAGNDASGGVYDRFKAFVSAFIFARYPAPDEYADVLYYGCRNPLLHSFNVRQKKYAIAVIEKGSGTPVWRIKGHPTGFVISVEGLVQAFVKAVHDYETAVRAKADLQANFSAMFPDYGSIGVQTYSVDKVTS